MSLLATIQEFGAAHASLIGSALFLGLGAVEVEAAKHPRLAGLVTAIQGVVDMRKVVTGLATLLTGRAPSAAVQTIEQVVAQIAADNSPKPEGPK